MMNSTQAFIETKDGRTSLVVWCEKFRVWLVIGLLNQGEAIEQHALAGSAASIEQAMAAAESFIKRRVR